MVRVDLVLAVIAFLSIAIPGLPGQEVGGASRFRITDAPHDLVDAFLMGFLPIGLQGAAELPPQPNPTANAPRIYATLREARDLEANDRLRIVQSCSAAAAALEALFIDNGKVRAYPNPAYSSVSVWPAGWTSCMDHGAMALANYAMFENSGDSRWRERALEQLVVMTTPYEQGGYMALADGPGEWSDSADSHPAWLMEYRSDGTLPSQEINVLNGWLWGLHALALILRAEAEMPDHKEVRNLLLSRQAALVAGYRVLARRFHYPDDSWCYYAIGKNIENQTHYCLFEATQLVALNELFPNDVFGSELAFRRHLLAETLPIYVDPLTGQISIVRAAAPHPYNIDCYRSIVAPVAEMRGGGSKAQMISGGDGSEPWAFGRDRTFSMWADKMTIQNGELALFAQPSCGPSIFVHSSTPVSISGVMPAEPLKLDLKALFDTRVDALNWHVDPAIVSDPASPDAYINTQGRLIFSFDPIRVNPTDFYCIALSSNGSIPIGIDLNGKDLKEGTAVSMFRYYPGVRPGIVLIAVSPIGFVSYRPRVELSSITLYFYTHASSAKLDGKVLGAWVASSPWAFHQLRNRLGEGEALP